MEHGQIVKFYDIDRDIFDDSNSAPHIVIRYGEYYLLLSMSNFNRREDFLTEITEKYKELDANVLDLSIPEIIDCHIEMNDIEPRKIHNYDYGMVIKHKITKKSYGMIVVRQDGELQCFLIDYKTFKLSKPIIGDWQEQMDYISENYDFYFYISNLHLNIKE